MYDQLSILAFTMAAGVIVAVSALSLRLGPHDCLVEHQEDRRWEWHIALLGLFLVCKAVPVL